ncbi:inner membrane protein import complex subunit Tim54-domain-containing protein [Fomitopsis serialis]|uniref:inner membrane protein import complex subunit Tim54-domain-containing protein n=1 Tax=Fomitopsis serialis TaxID=139415 RepID=UPI0020079C95|nr:inner membrane protein import complex subunit Tim54-domain-containing protein [Neoantrodia serialis]KAH9928153.1 inner membrane protein import complex subunit Tim54-domain-containing protein [Neoantrodia serialis]
MINGKRHGDLARHIADDIKRRRRVELGLDQVPVVLPHNSLEDKRRRELEGGIVVVGRPTFKELMAGLKKGWTETLEIVDREEKLSRELENDGKFDEREPESSAASDGPELDGEPIPTASRLPSSQSFAAFTPPHLRESSPSSSKPSEKSSIPDSMNTPPTRIPSMPPILLVHFVDHIGFLQIPHMIWEFFNQRHKVRSGAEAAYRLVMGLTRPLSAPPAEELSTLVEAESQSEPDPSQPHLSEPSLADLDFDKDVEGYYKKSYVRDFAAEIGKAREEYYEKLPARLETARSLARGTREPTKEEVNYPPPTEVELRAERMKKELRWQADEEGWDIVRPGKPVAWDERFREVLKVFMDLPAGTTSERPREEETK